MTRDIPLTAIRPDPDQPRKHFDAAALTELAESMQQSGLATPILVRPAGDGYVIVAGERRWRAALQLGWETIRADVQDLDDDQAGWLTLVENLQRADLTPLEEAEAFARVLAGGITQTELAARIGKTQSHVAQKLRLLRLPDSIKAALTRGDLSEGHARQILRLNDPERQRQTAELAIERGMTVRDVAAFIADGGPLSADEAAELRRMVQKIEQGRSAMEQNASAVADNIRAIAAVLNTDQLQQWAASQGMTFTELAAMLDYTGGPMPDVWIEYVIRHMRLEPEPRAAAD